MSSSAELGTVKHTDANHQRTDGEAGDGVLDQIRRARTEKGGGSPHARIVVSRLEWFAATVSIWHATLSAEDTH